MAKDAPPSRRATPPWWLLVAAAGTAGAVVLHTRLYDSWQVYEWTLLGGSAVTAIGLVAWVLRALAADRPGLSIVLVGCVLGLAGVALGAGGLVYPVVAGAAIVFVLPLTLLLGLLQLRLRRRGASRTLLAVAIACGVQLAAGLLGEVVRWHDCEAAKRWCDGLVDGIDRYHARNEAWPYDLEGAGIATGPRPRRLRGERFWRIRKEGAELRMYVRSRKFLSPTEWWWSTDLRQWVFSRT